jgi:CRISPR type III-A-associated RAMP protein Csm5
MSNIEIQTLTPVHIGSGYFLQYNTEFVEESSSQEKYIHVIDPRKILELIGEENLQDWLNSIEKKENSKDFVKCHAPQANLTNYTKRKLRLQNITLKETDTLKESIHDGTGLPYIPGSSIKGAIRTAILSSHICKMKNLEGKIQEWKGSKHIVTATNLEKELFGENPNMDSFRFIRVGDAYFKSGDEIATRMININLREKADLKDTSKPQLVEAIGVDASSIFQLKIDKDAYLFSKQRSPAIGNLPVTNICDLFNLINQHTKTLVEGEIRIWNDIDKTGADDYLANMKDLLSIINKCEGNKSCVLRIGYASGWRFITGAWTESLSNFDSVVVPASRPKNFNYAQYIYPKSRRIDEDSDIFGFVKLTLIS